MPDQFSAEERERARRYHRPLYWAIVVRLLLVVAVYGLLAGHGITGLGWAANAAAWAAMDDPAVQKRIADLGMNLPAADIKTPAAFAAFHKAEVEKWYPIVKAAGVKAEQ